MILAQILIAMVVTTILSTAVIQRADIRNRTVEADNTVKEMELITEAAQNYRSDNSVWPDETGCAGAIDELLRPSLSSNTYLVNIDTTPPFRSNPSMLYATSCNIASDTFTIAVTSNDVFAGYIATLSGGTLTGTATPQIETAVTVTPNRTTSTLSAIFTELGPSLYSIRDNTIQQDDRNLLFIRQYTIDVGRTPPEPVPKPVCNSGGIQNDPKVHLSMGTRMAAADGKPIIGWNIFIATENATEWVLSAEIFTEDSPPPQRPQVDTFVVAQTYCDIS